MEEREVKKYLVLGIFAVLFILSYYIIKPYIIVIISSFILAYFLLPVNKKISRAMNKNLASFISILIFVLIILIPAILVSKILISEVYSISQEIGFEKASWIISDYASKLHIPEKFVPKTAEIIEKSVPIISSALYYLLKTIPNFILAVILTLFCSFFILRDFNKIEKHIYNIIPFKNKDKIIEKVSKTSKELVYGTLVLAIIEFFVSLLGFKIAGINFYVIYAFLTAVMTFIPLLGPGIIWIPIFIIQLISQNYFSAIVILITGICTSILIDSLFRTIFLGKKAHINQIVLLLGVLGGVSIFGIFGFIIGPLILSISLDIISALAEEE